MAFVLIGFMGAGKSHGARDAAELLQQFLAHQAGRQDEAIDRLRKAVRLNGKTPQLADFARGTVVGGTNSELRGTADFNYKFADSAAFREIEVGTRGGAARSVDGR